MAVTELRELATATADAEALFREARQRRRRRRLGVALSLLVAAAGIGIGFEVTQGGSPPATAAPPTSHFPLPSSAAAFAAMVVSGTRSARIANMSFVLRVTAEGGCIPDTNTPVTQGAGVVDYAHHAAATTMTTRGCQNLGAPWSRVPTKTIQIGANVFETLPPGHGSPTSKKRPWVTEPADDSPPSLSAVMTSPEMLDVLSALSGQVERSGSVVIHGVQTTRYSAHMTLASFYSAMSNRGSSNSSSGLVPPANTIVIPITVWVDAAHRLVRLQATEPLYTAVYEDGSDQELAVQAQAQGFSNGHFLGIRRLSQQSSSEVIVDLSNFGVPIHISPPSGSQIAHSAQ
jgi:hypothetical protein